VSIQVGHPLGLHPRLLDAVIDRIEAADSATRRGPGR
jgi:hypothetical protein